MIFVDSNVPMYLVGSPHPNKERAEEALERLSQEGGRFVTDIEVYQEILHRYTSIRRPEAINYAFRRLDDIVDDVLTFGRQEIRDAREILQSVPGISARDALHAAVMQQAGITRILSYDRGFDAIPSIERLE